MSYTCNRICIYKCNIIKQYTNANKNVLTYEFTNVYKQKGTTHVITNVFTNVSKLSNVTLLTASLVIQTMT